MWETLILNLSTTADQTLSEANTGTAQILRALKVVSSPKEDLASVLSDVASRLDSLPEIDDIAWRRAMKFMYLMVRHKREANEQQSLFDIMEKAIVKHAKELEDKTLTGAQVLIEQGRKEGRQEGHQEGRNEGRVEGSRQSLINLLIHKFGVLSGSLIERINVASESEIDAMLVRTLTAMSLQEVVG